MSGNTFGKIFRVTTFGESHGKALGCVIDGCPPNIKIDESDIQKDLDRRKPGQSKYTTQRKEDDKVEILSGVFNGVTTGTPIALLIFNKDQKSKDYSEIKSKFRPGHADFTYQKKYGIRDYRGAGRSSARETVARVAAGAIAKKYLQKVNRTKIFGYVSQLGEITPSVIKTKDIETNPFFFPDNKKVPELEKYITSIRKAGDSIGAKVTIVGKNIPVGLGEPVFDKLDALLAQAMMSINAVKGVEIGAGFDVVNQKGSEARDEITPKGFLSNFSGGTLGGISTGQDLKVNIALKPTSSILIPGKTIDEKNKPTTVRTKGRHDPCVGIRAVPIAEAMMALTLCDLYLRHKSSKQINSLNMNNTLYDKIWDEHCIRNNDDKTSLIYIDRHLIHEVTSPQAFDGLDIKQRDIWNQHSILATTDHNVPTINRDEGIADPVSKLQIETLRNNCKKHNLQFYDLGNIKQGIVHVIGPELGMTQPGMTLVCGDSHTSTHGALASLAFGIGTSDVEHVLATQCLNLKKKKILKLKLMEA